MFSFDPIVRSLEGIQRELARQNELMEMSLKLSEKSNQDTARRYAEIALKENEIIANAKIQTDLSAIAQGYEKCSNGYILRPRCLPDSLVSGETQ